LERLLAASAAIERALYRLSMAAGWLFVACTVVIVFDVLTRKFGYQIPGMGSTRLQELEWHLHTALFSFWLGIGYIKNSHVRIDIALSKATRRTRAIMELLGCLVFAIPYCVIAIYFSLDFTWIAFVDGESSASANGLPHRWIPKSFISLGLILLLIAVLSVLMRVLVYLYGPPPLRDRAASVGVLSH
jgi:TRAP-type mannitol/chloroaromatic compound transport system permease small subunit